jgi:hypothetical protein
MIADLCFKVDVNINMNNMKHKKAKSLTLLLGLAVTGIHAQDASTASGGEASGSGGTVSYSIGQVVYTTVAGSTGSVAQGVQQPYEISIVTSIENTKEIDLQLSTYPNPTADLLNLKIGKFKAEGLLYQLFDINGKLLLSGQITDPETRISMVHLQDAIYFLKVIDNATEVKTFKIIKN